MRKSILFFSICSFSLIWSFSFAQNVGIGILAPLGKLHVKGEANISQLIIDANSTQGNLNPLIRFRKSDGTDLMWIHSDDYTNSFVGFNAGRFNNAAGGGYYNTFIGSFSGSDNTTGDGNTATGWSALRSNVTGIGNTAFGFNALYYSTSSFNTSYGLSSLLANNTGESNTGFGAFSLQTNTTGSKNTAVGANADVISNNLINATAIGYNAKVGSSNSLVLGGTGTNAVNVGIGTTNPNAKLEVVGTLKVVDGTQGAGKILTSNATGLASWQPPPPPPPTYYPSVTICCQSWRTKNLDVATYRNGDAIPKVTDNAAWAALTTGAYCYYNNDSTTYAATYGKLYNWYAVNDSRGLAPEGWHIPTDFEWTTLGNCLGGVTVAGGPMKETGTTHWTTPNTGATNLSGFTGLPGGYRFYVDGMFYNVGNYGYWWSSTEQGSAWYRFLYYIDDDLGGGNTIKRSGFSVRCLRD